MSVEILVVDDEPDLALLIRQKFRKRIRSDGWKFHFAQNGVEALKVIDQEPEISIVLTDINMPEMDGLTLLEHLSKIDRLLKAVVVSAYGDMNNIRTAMNRGAFDFITKPVDFNDLEITVDKTLREVIAFRQALESQVQLAAIQKELTVAKRIQQAFIPGDSFVHANVEVQAYLDMAYEVGGDFYDFFMLDGHKLAIIVGDVAGKGISAALFMAITRTILKAVGLRRNTPSECLTEVNTLLFPQSLAEVFVTVLYGIIDLSTGMFSYSTAGHFPPYMRSKNGTVQLLKRTGDIGLCMTRTFTYHDESVQLKPGDSLFFYTDGVPEAASDNGDHFSHEQMEQVLTRTEASSPQEILDSVIRALEHFTSGAEQSDDTTMLALTYQGATTPVKLS